jgi:PHD/YefM family antitoxin component YafN of YafNO toxin-antitoxin module
MVGVLPQMEKISILKNNQDVVLEKVKTGPVLLMQRSNPLVMLVTPDHWNATIRRIADLEAENSALKARFDADPSNWYSQDDLDEGMRKRGLID